MDLNERLERHFADETAAIPRPNPGATMERGDVIVRRRRVTGTVLSVAAVALVAFGVWTVGNRQLDTDIPEVMAAPIGEGPVTIQVANTQWDSQPGVFGWPLTASINDAGVIYALSTAPGARWEDFPDGNIPRSLYVSTDGREWATTPVDIGTSQIGARDGVLYAVSTSPDIDNFGLRLLRSDDQGSSFEDVDLVGAQTAVPTDLPTSGDWGSAGVAVTAHGVLAFGQESTSVDVSQLVPEDVRGAGELIVTADGAAMFGVGGNLDRVYEACYGGDFELCAELVDTESVWSATWAELGVDESILGATGDGMITSTISYWSEDGAQFEPIANPFPGDATPSAVFQAGDFAFASLAVPAGVEVFASDDGRNWVDVALPAVSWIVEIGKMGDTYVVIGAGGPNFGPVVYASESTSGPWRSVDIGSSLPDIDPDNGSLYINSATVEDSGVAIGIAVDTFDQGRGDNWTDAARDLLGLGSTETTFSEGTWTQTSTVLTTKDLNTWSALNIGAGVLYSTFITPDGGVIANIGRINDEGPWIGELLSTTIP